MINYSLTTQRVGTGASYGATVDDDHARLAVVSALSRMDDTTVGSVLLFLSSAYAHSPQNAIKQAAIAAGTPQIFGCCALSLLTEDEWLMDVEGAVAMVFPRDLALQPLNVLERLNVEPDMVLTLSSPNAVTIAVNSTNRPQIGAITSDEYGHGPYSVWRAGHIQEHEFSLMAFPQKLKAHVLVANGVKRLSPTLQVNLTESHSLKQVDQKTAYHSIPAELRALAVEQPYNLLCAISENNNIQSIEEGHFKLHHVVSIDQDSGHIQLSGRPKSGRHIFWAARDSAEAEKSMQEQLLTLKKSLDSEPLFALMFPNMSRGAEFFGGRDLDHDCVIGSFPDTPLIGFYGNGEITPGYRKPGLIRRYSTVLVIYTEV